MKTVSLIKALTKAGIAVDCRDNLHVAKANGRVIEWHDQQGEAIAVRVRCEGDTDDMRIDYHAGSFCRTLRSALNFMTEGK